MSTITELQQRLLGLGVRRQEIDARLAALGTDRLDRGGRAARSEENEYLSLLTEQHSLPAQEAELRRRIFEAERDALLEQHRVAALALDEATQALKRQQGVVADLTQALRAMQALPKEPDDEKRGELSRQYFCLKDRIEAEKRKLDTRNTASFFVEGLVGAYRRHRRIVWELTEKLRAEYGVTDLGPTPETVAALDGETESEEG